MKPSATPAFPARRNAVVIFLVVAVTTVALVIAFMRIEGPVAKCEAADGQMLVGPGGETACVSPRTFLPIDTPPTGKTAH